MQSTSKDTVELFSALLVAMDGDTIRIWGKPTFDIKCRKDRNDFAEVHCKSRRRRGHAESSVRKNQQSMLLFDSLFVLFQNWPLPVPAWSWCD